VHSVNPESIWESLEDGVEALRSVKTRQMTR